MVFRRTVLAAAGSGRLRSAAEGSGVTRALAGRFIAGETLDDAVRTVRALAAAGLSATVDHLGEDVDHPARAGAVARAYGVLLERLGEEGLTGAAEVSVKPTAVGLGLGGEGEALAEENIARICAAAEEAGTTATLDMEAEWTVAPTLRIADRLRARHPGLGIVLQSRLRRTEDDVRRYAALPGARVRLVKGAYAPSPDTAHRTRGAVDAAYVRCLHTLMAGPARPLVATHDPRLIAIARTLALRHGRAPGDHEFQMVYGARPAEQERLAGLGERVRVYVPYGREWYGYLLRRLAERPAYAAFAARSLLTRS
ncbi:proline dehydrogenase family protein [Nocardiopsis halophila]|uniref:proline dehydrogenase family protein n=1 Tax=Nocardiopsis halophila TaxID=141692 RepID=UPI00034A1D33|nr:proline dehydrogenase family protein [Nocardiopsis halophila]